MTREAFIRRETAISVVVNAAISAGICWLVFGGNAAAPIWSVPGIVADTVPQGFMVALMAALVPGLLARRAVARGLLDGSNATTTLAIVRRAIVTGATSALVATAIIAALFAIARVDAVPFGEALVLKIVVGAAIAFVVTPRALRGALARREATCA